MNATAKIDLKRTLDCYQGRRGTFHILEIPTMQYLMVDGHGDPNTAPAYAEAIEALYPLAYTLKFASKTDRGRDYVVPPLEGLWWAEDMAAFTGARDKSRWDWTMMILTPEWLTAADVAAAVVKVAAKARPTRLDDVRLESLSEGWCVQTLHIGSYDDEAPVLAAMHDQFIPDHGLRMVGKHHEIYLGDPRRVAPQKLRTLLRQPVEGAAGQGN